MTRTCVEASGGRLWAKVGSLEAGKLADLQLYAVPDYRMLPYRFGQLRPAHVVKRAACVIPP